MRIRAHQVQHARKAAAAGQEQEPTFARGPSGGAHATRARRSVVPHAGMAFAEGSVEVRQSAIHGQGLFALQGVEEGGLVHAIPLADTLMLFKGGEHELCEWYRGVQQAQGLPPGLQELCRTVDNGEEANLKLAALLLWQRQYGSEAWRSYCAALPRLDQATLLSCYTAADVRELQVPEYIVRAREVAGRLQLHHASLLGDPGLLHGSSSPAGATLAATPADSLWAYVNATSRSFAAGSAFLLVPVADAANHEADGVRNCRTELSTRDKSFQLWSLRDISADEELTIHYSSERSNLELMTNYGFVVPGNPYDTVMPLFAFDGMFAGPDSLSAPALLQALGVDVGGYADPDAALDALECDGLDDVAGARRRTALRSLLGVRYVATGAAASMPLRPAPMGPDYDEWESEDFAATPQAPAPLGPAALAQQRAALAARQELLADLRGMMATSMDADAAAIADASFAARPARVRAAVHARLEYKRLMAAADELLSEAVAALRATVKLPS